MFSALTIIEHVDLPSHRALKRLSDSVDAQFVLLMAERMQTKERKGGDEDGVGKVSSERSHNLRTSLQRRYRARLSY